MIRHIRFDPSWTLLVGGGLFILCSLPGLPVVNNSHGWLRWRLAWVGSLGQCVSPNRVGILPNMGVRELATLDLGLMVTVATGLGQCQIFVP